MGLTKKGPETAADVPPHIKLFNDVRNRLEIEKQVTFEESGRAFVQAQERVAAPETRQFVNDVMGGAVEIFLNQSASSVLPGLLIHFEDVLRSAARIISWELRTLRSIRHLDLLGKMLDETATFYQDKKVLIAGVRRCGLVRLTIARELLQDGTYTLLLQMMRGHVPILEWAPADFTPPAGKPAPDQAPLTARIMDMIMMVAFNSRIQEVDLPSFGTACMKEVNEKFIGETLKRQKAEDVMEMHAILTSIFGAQDEALHEFSLSLWLRCFESDAFSIKKLGLENLIRVCSEASRLRLNAGRVPINDPDRFRSATASASTSTGSAENPLAPSTTWDDVRVCAWLVDKRVLDNLFGSGSQTHSALVARSKSLLEYMALAGTLGPAQIDLIFNSCVGQHESSRGAVHSLLAELLLDLAASPQCAGPDAPPIVILRRATTVCDKRPEEMFHFARKLMQLENSARNRGIMISRNPDIQKSLLEFLWALAMRSDLSPGDENESEQRAEMMLSDFNDALRTAVVPLPTSYSYQKSGEKMNEDKIFSEFLRRCEDIIKPVEREGEQPKEYPDSVVWHACSVLKHLIQLHPDVTQPQEQMWMMDRTRPEWTKQSQTSFVEDLERRLHLSDWLVERIVESPSELGDRKARTRLDFLRFVAERIKSYDCLDFEKLKRCWASLASRPELRLTWFQELVATAETGRPRVLSTPVISRVFSDLVCASPVSVLGSEKGFDCFAAYFDEVNKDIVGPMASVSSPRSSLAENPPVVAGSETLWTIAIQGSGKVADKASTMLLHVQRRLEASNRESGVAFVERVMNALRQALDEERRKRCLKLISSYFGSQVILDSHAGPMIGGGGAPVDLLSSTNEIVVHHDDVLTFSVDDIGKVMEKRFREKVDKSRPNAKPEFCWYAGLIYDFNPETHEHSVFFKDGDTKRYDMKSLVREGSPVLLNDANPNVERQQFRMLSVVSDGPLKLDQKVPVTQSMIDALRRYRGIKMSISAETTLEQLKTHVLNHLGRKGFDYCGFAELDFRFQIELDAPYAMVPEFLRLRTNNPAAANGKPVNYVRYHVMDETLPAGLIASRFGGRLFLCAVTLDGTPQSSPASSPKALLSSSTPSTNGDQEVTTPSSHLAREDSPDHALLMNLIQDSSLSEETRKETWNLLMTLPTERGLLHRAMSDKFDWCKEFDASGKAKTVLIQVYLLQVAISLLQSSNRRLVEPQWDKSSPVEATFFTPEMAERILRLFSRVMSRDFTDEWERGVALRVLVRLIKLFVEHKLVPNPKQLSQDLTCLILWDMKNVAQQVTTSNVPSVATTPKRDEVETELNAGVTSDLSLAAMSMEMELVEDDANHTALLDCDGDSGLTLTDVLLESPQVSIRESTYRLLLRITETNRNLVFSCVLRTLIRVPDYTRTCSNFFDYVNEFIVMGTPEQGMASCSQLMDVVRTRLMNYAYSGSGEDPTLNGFLDLCKKLVEHGAGSEEQDAELIQTILSRYLLAVSGSTLNVASSPPTRHRCFALLRVLAAKSARRYCLLIKQLNGFVSNVDKPMARGGRTWDFNFRADDTRRPPGTCVGLVNQGATCYQNSVLQQLFMRKEMRNLILNAIPNQTAALSSLDGRGGVDDEEAELGGEPLTKKKPKSKLGLLNQLQKLFSFLESSEQKFFNPRLFVNQSALLRLTDGHMSQNDCIEFYSLLMEYLEEVFKGRPEREQLRNLFVSSMTSLTMRHCPNKHRSEKEESTFYISLSIRYGPEGRALNSLVEALDEWSKSEHLSDLICEDCFPPPKPQDVRQLSSNQAGSSSSQQQQQQPQTKQRFDADQVKFITRFPPVLVLQLKRFDFDYDTLLPTKLNHRVSFEQRLDLGRFTREAVLRQYEGGNDEKEEPHVWYRLKGVVVHQGTGANFGHYYSFIEDDEKQQWFRFDDERVTPFDLANLEEECFGGPVTDHHFQKGNTPAYAAAAAASSTKRPGFGSGGLRNNNGYLLIYTRETSEEAPLTTAQSIQVPSSMSDKGSFKLKLRTAGRIVNLVLSWRARARMYLEAKQMIKEHEQFVAKENERALRHSIAFATDFLTFCLRVVTMAVGTQAPLSENDLVEVGKFTANSMTRIVLFAASEKERYEQWMNALKNVLSKSPESEKSVYDWLLKKVTTEEGWLERLLVQCLDARSSALFTEMLVHAVKHSSGAADLIKSLVENMIRIFPKLTLGDASPRYIGADGNYFVVLRALATLPVVRPMLLAKDVVLHLIRLLDESAQEPVALTDQQRRARGSDMTAHATIVRDEKLCTKVVSALDALLIGEDDADSDDDDEDAEENGFPLLPPDSAKALFADSLLMILIQYSPRASKRLIARLCDCSMLRFERCFDALVNMLNASQYAKAAEAGYIIPDCCEVLEYLYKSLELDPNARPLREKNLSQLIKLVRETKKIATEKKEAARSTSSYYASSSYVDERMDTQRAAALLITHVLELIASLAVSSDACRSVLKQIKWNWIVQAGEVNSYEGVLGGNEQCATRDVDRGRGVREMIKAAIGLGQLPRPIVYPCFTLSYYVEDAGTPEVNGMYRFDGFFPPGASETVDTVSPKFARVDASTGKRFSLFKCSATDSQLWYISELSDKPGTTSDTDYYQSKDSGSGLPDGRWVTCGQGTKPAPKHLIPSRVIPNPEDDLLEFFVQ